ncbi:hypothetical protein BGZ65_010140 [Modicella reniformis]|uniref:Uncharacterized protein n=1 Tax=Modicella reniformis TaxID=1440133 RepID=A0A9P6IND2_9FUNG|nr:hypothetical protein BGZ65_010140 [Modicella reniformis]
MDMTTDSGSMTVFGIRQGHGLYEKYEGCIQGHTCTLRKRNAFYKELYVVAHDSSALALCPGEPYLLPNIFFVMRGSLAFLVKKRKAHTHLHLFHPKPRLWEQPDGTYYIMDDPIVVEAMEGEPKAQGKKDPVCFEYLD